MNNLNKIKLSQLSLFIIISTILVIGTASFYLFTSDSIELFQEDKDSNSVKQYVESCLLLEMNRGIEKLSNSGGWLYSDDTTYNLQGINFEKFNKEISGVKLFNTFKNPYNYYFDDQNKKFVTKIASYNDDDKNSIKSQLERYINENIEKNCINDFLGFRNVFDIKAEKPKTTVNFVEEEIEVNLKYPLQINYKNSENSDFLESYFVKLPNQFYESYLISKMIVNKEKNNSFVEQAILNTLITYQGTKKDLLPPFYEQRYEADYGFWDLDKTKILAKGILNTNVFLINFEDTYKRDPLTYPKAIEDEDFVKGLKKVYTFNLKQGNEKFLKNLEWDIESNLKNYEITPNYEFFYPTYLDFYKNKKLLFPKTKSLLGDFPLYRLDLTTYRSSWEFSIPISFKIKNKKTGFEYNFFIETNIKNNLPLKDLLTHFPEAGSIETIENGDNLICNKKLFISGNHTIQLIDPLLKKPIQDANVEFDCKGIEVCNIGQTNEKGILNFKLPTNCDPGKLNIQKQNYRKTSINLNPKRDVDFSTKIGMYSLKKFPVTLRLNRRELKDEEELFLIFSNEKAEELTQILMVNKDNKNKLEIKLIPNLKYKVEGLLRNKKSVTIPEEVSCPSFNFLGNCVGKKIRKKEIVLKEFINGIYKFNKTFSTSSIKNYNSIILNVESINTPTNYDELGEIGKKLEEVKVKFVFKN